MCHARMVQGVGSLTAYPFQLVDVYIHIGNALESKRFIDLIISAARKTCKGTISFVQQTFSLASNLNALGFSSEVKKGCNRFKSAI